MIEPSVVAGSVWGRLTVNERIDAWAVCQCECGKTHVARAHGLKVGSTRSCGCLKSEVDRARMVARNKDVATHGMSKGLIYTSWYAMIMRCLHTQSRTYATYGARGIKVCERLRVSPQNLADTIGSRVSREFSIDRFPDRSGHYSCGRCNECLRNNWPLNVRWATRKQQGENRKSNVYLTAFGKTMLRSQWEAASGINEETVRKRLRRGWSIERALTTPDSFGNHYMKQAASG